MAHCIVDVFVGIERTKEYVMPFSDEEEFNQSSADYDAAIRELNIIREALNRLLEDEQFTAASSAYLRNIVDLRDLIAESDVDRVGTLEVWDLITNKLVLLDNDLKNVVHSSNINMGTVIETELRKYFQLDDKKSVGFLKKLNREMY